MTSFTLKKGVDTLIDLCKDLEVDAWLEMVDFLEESGGDTENFTFEEWFVLWLVRQNQLIFKKYGHYFTEQGFYDLSEVIPEAPIFKDKSDITELLQKLESKRIISLKGNYGGKI